MGVTLGCDTSTEPLPEVWKPLAYETVAVDLPGCAIGLPPVRDSTECSAAAIGQTIAATDVCRLLMALKDWVESAPTSAPSVQPEHWTWVRAVCLYRSIVPHSPHASAETRLAPRPSFLTLYADVGDAPSAVEIRRRLR
jgi:hypothetical protein